MSKNTILVIETKDFLQINWSYQIREGATPFFIGEQIKTASKWKWGKGAKSLLRGVTRYPY
jgi:hypothetical protein